VPSTFCLIYLQAHPLDLEFHDTPFGPGAYLTTRAEHMGVGTPDGCVDPQGPSQYGWGLPPVR
jgi:hypothetical protein